jgi:hypothetical protein
MQNRLLIQLSKLLWAGLLLGTTTALAQGPITKDLESARDHRESARALKQSGDLKGAAAEYKVAHAFGRTPVTGIDLADAYVAIGLLVEARDVANSVVSMPVGVNETARSTEARSQAASLVASLKDRLSSLKIVIEKVPATSSIEAAATMDGQQLSPETLGEVRKVNPGSHTIVARLGATGEEKTVMVVLKEGETKSVSLRIRAPEVVPAVGVLPPPRVVFVPEQTKKSGVSPLVYVGAGLGGVGGIVGSVFGGLALSKKSELNKTVCPNNTCPPGSPLGEARSFGTVSTVGFVVAGAGVGLMITGLVLGGSKTETQTTRASVAPWLGPNGGGLSGAF